ncbi:MAG: TonB-dependent receptor [Acidobacteria bacterium]|nr:TonB-dependent receptor [Acidobacteriota bacterium]
MNPVCLSLSRLLAAALVLLLPLPAQVSTGSVAGQVTDSTGAVVAAAKVTLLNEGTGQERTAMTEGSGAYVFPLVQPGYYTVRVEMQGFKGYAAHKMEVQVSQQVTHDVRLDVGETSTTVEVAAVTPVLDQRSAEVGQVIGQREVVELPLNGRNFLDLAKLAPGVTELGTTTQSNGLAINGQRANQIGFYFDGVDTRTETSGKPAFSPSIEAIQEFKIQQNDFAAEFGRSPAGINLTLRSGGNDFHGAVFEFLRNNKLDARSYFSPRVDPLRRNQFGAVVTGPIVHNKTFFMANFEGLRTRRANTLFRSVPTSLQRDGNFTEGGQVYDPATYDAASNTRQPFSGNIIPKARFGRMGNAALQYYPAPNSPGSGGFNYVVSASSQSDSNQVHTRVDHQISSRDSIFGRVSYSKGEAISPSGLPLTGGLQDTKAASVTVQESHTFSPSVVNQFRLAWTYFKDRGGFPLADRNLAVEDFGMLNLTPSTDAYGLPQLNVAGLTTIGSNSFQPSGPRENFYSLANDLSWVRGKHSMKFGFDGRYYRPAALVQQTPNSILTFENRFTNQPGVARTGNAIADLVLGQPYTGRATLFAESNGWVSLKYYYTGFYVQDEIRLNPKLTLNLGVRYEYQTPYYERFGDLAIFDLYGSRFLKLDEDIKQLHQPDKNNFAPRIGIAYSVSPKTVIRTGFGVFYGQPRGSEFSSFQLSPPFVIDTTLTSNPNVPDLIGRLFPRVQVRDGAGKILLSPNVNVFSLDTNWRTNYTWQWNFGIQRELANGLLLETGYVGNAAHKMTGRDLPNQAVLDVDPLRPTPVLNRRPNPNIGDVSYVSSLDNSNYHALTVKLNKRIAGGFSLLGGYTYSKVMGIGGALFGDQSRQQDARNRRAEYAALEFNQKQRLTMAWIYELPVGKGKRYFTGAAGASNMVVGGWSVQGNYTVHSGFPLTPTSSVSSNVGRQDWNRSDRTCDGNLSSGRTIDRWFDTSCFPNHAFGRFGNSGNGVIIGPGVNNFDFTIMKNTYVGMGAREPLNVQFRAEFFNGFNHASFADPNMTAGTAQFGVIRGTRINGREIQLALKLLF